MSRDSTARLLISCADGPGIVAAVSNFLFHHGANITALDQYSTDPEGGRFFMRLEFQTPHLDLSRALLCQSFQDTVAARYNMEWSVSFARDRKKVAVLVSKYDHVLNELLWRWSREDIEADITMVISNHGDLKNTVESFQVPFYHIPVSALNKEEVEKEILTLLEDRADLVVLARYMQILSEDFVSRYENKIINIHHSFLPAFVGANPYFQALERGVKVIGATAHYVTKELDMGPIINQDVVHVSHRDTVSDLKEKGRNVERNVLAQAVGWHLEDRIIVNGNKTIVFS
jgi:formyltetrahydrofolate deformylase